MLIDDFVVKSLVERLADEFMALYKEYIDPNEYDKLLTNGFCLYFASLLKQLLPEGMIFSTREDHYVFFYNNHFYDGTGELPLYDNIIKLFGEFKSIDNFRLVDNVQEEIDLGDILDRDYKFKEFVWEKIGCLLFQYGKQELEKLQEEQSRTI